MSVNKSDRFEETFVLSYEDIINIFKKYNKTISKELLEDLPFFLETLRKNHNILLKLGENKKDIDNRIGQLFSRLLPFLSEENINILAEMRNISQSLQKENETLKEQITLEQQTSSKQLAELTVGFLEHPFQKEIDNLKKENEDLKEQFKKYQKFVSNMANPL